ncbi:MAG: DNA translocase FtsK 4TM domain-containing protein [Phycisphaeraceae bacterium]|nr:DNA translocase FtsK 4TM domain-containing protein [Phycisphaeraceae bacterium]
MITEGSTVSGRAVPRARAARTTSGSTAGGRRGGEGAGTEGGGRGRSAREGVKAAGGPDASVAWKRVAWLACAVVWAFVTLSLFSYSPADAPGTSVVPHNVSVANLCGKAGAVVAHYGFTLLGHGAWVLVALTALALGVTVTGRGVTQIPIRFVGAAMMACAVSGLQAVWLPTSGPVPMLPGGLVGTVGGGKLVESFSTVGSVLALLLGLCVGAVVALDVWALIVAAWTGRLLFAGARTGGRYAVAAARAAALKREQAKLTREEMRRRVMGAGGYRPDDLTDDAELPDVGESATTRVLGGVGGVGGRRPGGAGPVRRMGAGGIGGVAVARPARGGMQEGEDDPSLFDPAGGGLSVGDPNARGGVEDVVEDPDAAMTGAGADAGAEGGAKSFDPEQLRAKIAKLPVRFAAKERRAATEEDLKEVQQGFGEKAEAGDGRGGGSTPMNLEGYRFPGLDLLEEPEEGFSQTIEVFVREQAEALERALKEYRIDGEVVGVESGPVITLYEVRLAPGTKVSVLQAVASDLARALKSVNIRIVPNTAGRDTVGVEVPNAQKEKVRLKELMTRGDIHSKMALPMFLGKDASGEPLIADLATMPHILIAGTTGSGKSVCMNTIIMSFLYTKKPNELKLVLVDPKMVELSQFKDIPHLMCPVVTEMAKAAAILEWAVAKMDERYELLAEAGCRDIGSYNGLDWEELKDRLNITTPEEEARVPRKLPYMVFVIDELADLMMTNKEVEHAIVRIAQKARAVGMHLILATQRPQANVVTGLIKSNMPGRLCFKVASGMDSRIVLDQKGGELLLGQGDMLYLSPRSSKLTRSQGTLVDDREIRKVARFLRDVAAPSFERSLMQIRAGMTAAQAEEAGAKRDGFSAAQEDPLFDEAVEAVIESGRGSVSMLQRRLAIGYTRSARLIEMMGEAGILGGHKGTVSRDVIMTLEEWHAIKAQAQADAEGGGALNTHPTTGETLEVTQAVVNGRARAADEEEDVEEGELVDELEEEGDEEFEEEGEGEDDDDGEDEPPFDVQTRPSTGRQRV